MPVARSRLAGYLERVVFHAGPGPSVFDGDAFDEFAWSASVSIRPTPKMPC